MNETFFASLVDLDELTGDVNAMMVQRPAGWFDDAVRFEDACGEACDCARKPLPEGSSAAGGDLAGQGFDRCAEIELDSGEAFYDYTSGAYVDLDELEFGAAAMMADLDEEGNAVQYFDADDDAAAAGDWYYLLRNGEAEVRCLASVAGEEYAGATVVACGPGDDGETKAKALLNQYLKKATKSPSCEPAPSSRAGLRSGKEVRAARPPPTVMPSLFKRAPQLALVAEEEGTPTPALAPALRPAESHVRTAGKWGALTG